MATDKTEPRTSLLVLITALTVFTLVTLKFVFDSYFTTVAEQHVGAQVLDSAASVATRKQIEQQWESQLATPPTIEDAMRQLARGGRTGVALVAPTPSTDMGAVTGWGHRREGDHTRPLAYAPAPAAPPAPVVPEPAPVPQGAPAPEGAPAPVAPPGAGEPAAP